MPVHWHQCMPGNGHVSTVISNVYRVGDTTTVSKVYTLGMKKFVYVKVQGDEQAVKIFADKVEETEKGVGPEPMGFGPPFVSCFFRPS